MSEDQLEIRAQSALQQFDDACDGADTDPVALGNDAVNALDELIAGKPVTNQATRAFGCTIKFKA